MFSYIRRLCDRLHYRKGVKLVKEYLNPISNKEGENIYPNLTSAERRYFQYQHIFYQEYIIRTAIKAPATPKDARIYSVAAPGHHANVIQYLRKFHPSNNSSQEVQGFLTNTGRFVDREEGFRIAAVAKQIINRNDDLGSKLYSEDMWSLVQEREVFSKHEFRSVYRRIGNACFKCEKTTRGVRKFLVPKLLYVGDKSYKAIKFYLERKN